MAVVALSFSLHRRRAARHMPATGGCCVLGIGRISTNAALRLIIAYPDINNILETPDTVDKQSTRDGDSETAETRRNSATRAAWSQQLRAGFSRWAGLEDVAL